MCPIRLFLSWVILCLLVMCLYFLQSNETGKNFFRLTVFAKAMMTGKVCDMNNTGVEENGSTMAVKSDVIFHHPEFNSQPILTIICKRIRLVTLQVIKAVFIQTLDTFLRLGQM